LNMYLYTVPILRGDFIVFLLNIYIVIFSQSLTFQLNQGYALEEKSLEAGGHFSLEEQMQQRAATLANSNRSNNAVFSPIMQQDPVADSSVYQR
jgi:hypothetical protein